MAELKPGTTVDLISGGQIKVVKELGRGGQGIVYLSEFQGHQYALKWYTQQYPDTFYNNLKHNIEQGSPSKGNEFLWPLMLTKRQYDSFGYVMQLRPQGFSEFGDFLMAKAKFASISAMITAALQICQGFYFLHLKGYSYQDLNDGNFFINPQTGDVLICDNDNVTAQGQNTGILGKARYMAPEIVAGGKPDKYSDYFSLAIILFLLFYGNHPLEGKKVLSCPCMDEVNDRKFYGSEALFILDKDNKENLPVRGVHTNVITRWPLFTKNLQDAFIEALSQDLIKNSTKRIIESRWEKVITSMRNLLVVCKNCGNETFADIEKQTACINCGKPVTVDYQIKTTNYGNIVLSPKKNVFLGKSKQPVAAVRINKADPSVWALQNLSTTTWMVETPSGKLKPVGQNEIMPTKPGLKITFSQGEKGEIV
ncbi:MAG: protein kinase [Mariniphaga sp.]|nr:protein kinase [Mariniphaga sp.]